MKYSSGYLDIIYVILLYHYDRELPMYDHYLIDEIVSTTEADELSAAMPRVGKHSSLLKQDFSEAFDFRITKQHAKTVARNVLLFELRDDHPDALNTSLLGVHNIHFLPKDQQTLFEIFGVDKMDVDEIVKNCDSIDEDFKVSSDSYNLFSIWLLHKAMMSPDLNGKEKEEFMVNICKMLLYKFFSSLIGHNFPYGADESVMTYTINELSGKFDIKQPGTTTWKLMIEARAKDIIGKNSIHANTIKTFETDAKVVYVITDAQTRLRLKLRLIIQAYYSNKEQKNRIDNYKLVNEVDGEKLISNLNATFDTMIINISAKVLNVNRFINYENIKFLCKYNNTLREDYLKDVLMKFSMLATIQNNKRQQDDVIMKKGSKDEVEFYVGYRILLTKIIQYTYAAILQDRSVKIKQKLSILDKINDLYRSSRMSDPNLLMVKDSVDRFVRVHSGIKREATITSLKIGMILYIIMMTFDYD